MKIKSIIQFVIIKFLAVLRRANLIAQQSEALIAEARELTTAAEQEFQYGKTAMGLTKETGNKFFSAVARWHYQRCLVKYRLAASKFSEAGKLQVDQNRRRNLEIELQKISKHARYVELSVAAVTNLA